jgi:hypothetical protein
MQVVLPDLGFNTLSLIAVVATGVGTIAVPIVLFSFAVLAISIAYQWVGSAASSK